MCRTRVGLTVLAGLLALSAWTTPVSAQVLRGGEFKVDPVATAEERINQSDLWVMQVAYKPMRQIVVEITDPKTGEKKKEYVWYVVYRAFNRPIETRGDDNAPVNEFDPPVRPPMFVPEFTLVTQGKSPKVYQDVVCPECIAAINARERGTYKSSVDVVGPVPPAAKPNSPEEKPVWGVAVFRGVDPEADRYTVYMTGFSNGVKQVNGPDGQPIVQNKTIMMKYWRPGDQFDQREPEIRPDGEPVWMYR